MPADLPSVESIPLPERTDRRLRLGPFSSVGDAGRFALYVAAGAPWVLWLGPVAWIPVLAVAFLLTAGRQGAATLDERLYVYLAWLLRLPSTSGTCPMTVREDSRVAELVPGLWVGAIRCAGTPIAHLPREELERRFGQYRELIRSETVGFCFLATSSSLDPARWRPAAPAGAIGPTEAAARGAYEELVGLLVRRRQRRRIYLVLWSREPSGDGAPKLLDRLERWAQGLDALGVQPDPLRGRSLAQALRRLGEPGGPA